MSLEKIAQKAYNDEMEKLAGPLSWLLKGTANRINGTAKTLTKMDTNFQNPTYLGRLGFGIKAAAGVGAAGLGAGLFINKG